MKALFRLMMATIVTAVMAPSALAAEEKVVNVYNWSDYIDESILEDFTQKTGIKVVYDVFDSNEILETKMLAGAAGYDVVVPSGSFLSRQIQAGVFTELDKKKLPNLKNMWDVIQQRTGIYDPGNAYSVNYMWGTTGIGYNVDKVQERLGIEEITSWDVVFNPDMLAKLEDCGVHVLDAPVELIPAALAYLGKNPDSHKPDEIREAGELLKKARPYVQKFHSSEYINALANGDICLAVGWSGDIFQARDRADEAENNVKVAYSVPKEGALMWFDQLAIPVDAPHPENAHKFINYIMQADVIAKASNYVYYANGNKASQPLLEEDIIQDPAIYPTPEVLKNLYTTTPYPPKVQRVVTRVWTNVKTNQ